MDLDDDELRATKELFKTNKENQLKELNEKLFMLMMQDHWEDSDYRYEDELLAKIRKLEKEVDKEK